MRELPPVFPHMGWSCTRCRRGYAYIHLQWGCPHCPDEIPESMIRTAVVSQCGLYRYTLRRVWDEALPVLVFVMLNPSTADALVDDATIRKCVGFASRRGFGGIQVVNLFAYRATDPRDLRAADWAVGPDNDGHIIDAVSSPDTRVVCAWGAHARGRRGQERVAQVLDIIATWATRAPLALRVAEDGTPHHPLMLPYTCELSPFTPHTRH